MIQVLQKIGAVYFKKNAKRDAHILTDLESIAGVGLPDVYKKFLANMSGPVEFTCSVCVLAKGVPMAGKEGILDVDILYAATRGEYGLREAYKNYRYCNGNVGYFPIGEAPGGNLFCLGINKEHKNKVCYWDHEAPENEDIYPIFRTFADFLKGIHREPDREGDSDEVDCGVVAENLSFLDEPDALRALKAIRNERKKRKK